MMQVTIDNKTFDFELNGTVGVMFATENMLGHELRPNNRFDECALYYTTLVLNNKHRSDLPDFDTFLCNLTSSLLGGMSLYFWGRWNTLEGKMEPESEGDDEKNT